MMTKHTPKHLEAFDLIWPVAIEIAKAYLSEYSTDYPGGYAKQKLKRVQAEDHTKVHLISEVLWRLSGDAYTPHYWFTEIIDKAKHGAL